MDTIDFLSSCPINSEDGRAFGYTAAPYIFLAKRQEAVERISQDKEGTLTSIEFESHRELIESTTGLTVKEQKEIEKYLSLLGVFTIKEKEDGYLILSINHEIYDCIFQDPIRFRNIQSRILNK